MAATFANHRYQPPQNMKEPIQKQNAPARHPLASKTAADPGLAAPLRPQLALAMESLRNEKRWIEERIRQIDAVLGDR